MSNKVGIFVWILLFVLSTSAYSAELNKLDTRPCDFTNVLLVGKKNPSEQTIQGRCATYQPSKKGWLINITDPDGKTYQQLFPVENWYVYTPDGAIFIHPDHTFNVINTDMNNWDTVSFQCPYGDAVVVDKQKSKVQHKSEGEQVDCVNWDPERRMWHVSQFTSNPKVDKSRYLDPNHYEIYTMNGKLIIDLQGKVIVIPTYKEF